MNQTTGDSKKKQINGASLYKGIDEKEPIQAVEGTAFQTGSIVKLADELESSVEIKVGDVEIVRLSKKEDGIDAIYIPSTDEVLVVDNKKVTPSQHAKIKAKYEAYVASMKKETEEPQI